MKNKKEIILGVAGTLAAIAAYKYQDEIVDAFNEQYENLACIANDSKDFIMDEYDNLVGNKKESNNQLYIAGSILGLITGLAATTMMSTSTRKSVKKGLNQAFNGFNKKRLNLINNMKKKPMIKKAMARRQLMRKAA